MDRAEAINYLETIKHCDVDELSKIKALDMAIASLREQEQKWIGVEERLPENEDAVLGVTKNGRPFVCRYDHHWKHWRVSGSVKVTHWMPLPEPPEVEA